jgi:hypothetical protein
MSVTGPTVVYLLCLLASVGVALLLQRAWRRTRTRLLLWSAAAFALLALNNLFVVADMLLVREVNLIALRHASALAAVAVLLYGFIWEVD